MHLAPERDEPEAVAWAVTAAIDRLTALGDPWKPVDDPVAHLPPPDNASAGERAQWQADCYAEGVYFHEFVQSFLFTPRCPREKTRARFPDDPDPEPFRLFRRGDIDEVVVDIENVNANRKRRLALAVERLNLYLFRSGSAVLVLEVSNSELKVLDEWWLADVLDFHDVFRRAYLPFAAADRDGALTPSDLAVRSVTWRFGGETKSGPHAVSAQLADCTIAEYLDPRRLDPEPPDRRRFAPVLPHWRDLLKDALPLAPYDSLRDLGWREGEGRWHQVLDERMATLATVSVCAGEDGDPRYFFDRTRPGDLARLCFADRFSRDAYPYDPHFLRNFDEQHVYDRFRQDGTLYLASGYAFVAYGLSAGDSGRLFENVIATHMRRHYFQMGLLAHFELASLLAFSSRISRAVEHNGAHPEPFERSMLAIESEFLQFVHRFRFTGVSNHVQAQELFDLWRRHLRLGEVFKDLREELASATEYLFNRAASRSAQMTERLSAIATLGLMLGLSFSLVGMNLVFDKDLFTAAVPWFKDALGRQAALVLVVVVGFACIGMAALAWLRLLAEPRIPRRPRPGSFGRRSARWLERLTRPWHRRRPGPSLFGERFERSLGWLTAALLVVAAVLLLLIWLTAEPVAPDPALLL